MLALPAFDLGKAGLEPALHALFGGGVVDPVFEAVGEALHGGELVLGVVRIDIAFAVVKLPHEAGRGVADDEGDGLRDGVESVLFCAHIGDVAGVGFRRKREINHRFRQMNAAFRHSDEVARLIGSDGDLKRFGVCKTHVLACKAGHAAGDVEGVFARFQHARQPIDGGVRVGVAHGLVQGGDDVVVFLARLVIEEGLFRGALFEILAGDGDGAVVRDIAVEHRHLEGGERGTRVSVGKDRDGFDEVVRDVHLLPAETAGVFHRASEQLFEVVHGEGLQHEDLAAGEQRPVHLKGRVLRRGADEDDAPFLHKGEEGVLLRLVEAVDLIHKENGALAETAVFLRLLHDLFDLFYAAGDRGKVDEIRLGTVGYDAREGGLAHSRRTPEDHGADVVALDETAEHFSLAEEVFLPAILIQRLRTQARGERETDLVFKKCRLFEHHNVTCREVSHFRRL